MRERHEHLRCRDLVDGYLVRRPLEPLDPAFDRAKAELIQNLESQLASVRTFTVEEFMSKRP